ncbi:hypothetical protein CEXT_728561 [Caerostris extrusa]|uniref:Uncharacterized protein n=1 Tax=Caerostris extrusa TaxID=172846 RepID=A0AAV4WMS9_CAEEX|nr:hypothetical protein CEXT_728561 [Caerostris extrusa]
MRNRFGTKHTTQQCSDNYATTSRTLLFLFPKARIKKANTASQEAVGQDAIRRIVLMKICASCLISCSLIRESLDTCLSENRELRLLFYAGQPSGMDVTIPI